MLLGPNKNNRRLINVSKTVENNDGAEDKGCTAALFGESLYDKNIMNYENSNEELLKSSQFGDHAQQRIEENVHTPT